MGSAVLFTLRSRLLLYSAGSAVNRVQVLLSGFSMRLFCFVQAKTFWLLEDARDEHMEETYSRAILMTVL